MNVQNIQILFLLLDSVMMLAPFLVMLSSYLSRSGARRATQPDATQPDDTESRAANLRAVDAAVRAQRSPMWLPSHPAPRIVVPWFALGFVAVAALHSQAILPATWVSAGVSIDTVLLAMAMAALGVTTHGSAIRAAGIKPLALGAVLFTWLIVGGWMINAGVRAALG